MKVIAFYLPQYHIIPENDEWWGKGFTEWTNVKKAKPLFKGHSQPRVPLNRHYYNLLNKETLIWQADLANNYGIDAMCFYHYWFAGRLLLEKPAEILLANKDIDMQFLFSWANEPWTRTWDGSHKDILMAQEYGTVEDWEKHFNYLRPFFEDPRYLKHNGKPIFILYRSAGFDECDQWIACWRRLAKNTSFKDIHFVNSHTSFINDTRKLDFNANLYFEPMCTVGHDLGGYNKKFKKIVARAKRFLNTIIGTKFVENKLNYDFVWRKILAKDINEIQYPGAFVDWDNSARKNTRALVMTGASPEKFSFYFEKIYNKGSISGCPYIFINAWNEWAEGTYLEPDEKNKYSYLESIHAITKKNKISRSSL
ncbi:glycosyltransferase WbsX family protein [Citrobacter portucalensis]|uniref:glycosyltransferase WbsX family protein n=1 Tax=Citrobacter TaxID=544 RepID=UPI00129BE4E5|nr:MULTISPECIES: glycoside hydrolase family 99-like domain-containing protein [Citrobacter]MBW7618013.1 glycoside hydrolase family 99-like domain-containing protein [Citrobacter portucalensis]MBW7637231.1 glycoside hydrolase family 99-like domain-containing protein [Citrobacter portucalensis]MCA2131316.1 glycoside hydrolase family 99-like domain-containing protein [Citrobacter portucalensis]MCA2141495.1 glycoside hydrolase family 99-like domain-containing protein [Citrobacter portucalensis]MCA